MKIEEMLKLLTNTDLSIMLNIYSIKKSINDIINEKKEYAENFNVAMNFLVSCYSMCDLGVNITREMAYSLIDMIFDKNQEETK